ncbi:MAG: hypothetical protein ACFFG0_15165 [Candidatus Thorarchaeota archaeon]
MMLLESIGSFSFCDMFQRQSYLARRKLIEFKKEVQKNTFLWQSPEHHYRKAQFLELKEIPPLASLITDIFSTNLIKKT